MNRFTSNPDYENGKYLCMLYFWIFCAICIIKYGKKLFMQVRDRKIEIIFCLDTSAAFDLLFVFALWLSDSLDSTLESMIFGILILLPLPLIFF